MKKILTLLAGVCLSGNVMAISADAVLNNYADIAHAVYEDSLITAKHLQKAVDTLIAAPTTGNLQAARDAWKAARVPYQQSEAYRFGNAIVDDWEGKVNAWPLDEGLIDYVAADYGTESDENPFYTANIIANKTVKVGGKTIDASHINKDLIGELHELDEIEANVATGYHAIEFLLWGQDLNGTGPGAGNRPATDFDGNNCSWGNCERRAAYLKATTDLLIDDLAWMVGQWEDNGAARKALSSGGADAGISTIITGLGSLSYGELAGERIKLGLMVHDPEEEHDCFSDNTHYSHYYDAKGIQNVYLGSYKRINGSVVAGPSLSALVAAKDSNLDAAIRGKLENTMQAMQVLVDTAEGGEAYDQMIGEGNDAGNRKVMNAVEALVAQTREIEKSIGALQLSAIEFEGSDSLDHPEKVQ
ncbi:MAG: imelysin family protein [Chromatiales bacterium]|jgi:putative iron-regulated protein